MCQTPTEIACFFRKNKIDKFELIEYNEWKGRYCYLIELDGRELFLKWNRSQAQFERHERSLSLEKSIYHLLRDTGLVPGIIKVDDDDDFLITEYISGAVPLRKKIKELLSEKDIDSIENIVKQTITNWERYIVIVNERMDPDAAELRQSIREIFPDYYESLLCSGPFETKKYPLQHFRNTVINRFNRKLFLHKIRNRIDHLYQDGFPVVHGDFHANNILIQGESPQIIDLENSCLGAPEVELAYLYAQISLLLRKETDLRRALDEFIDQRVTALKDKQLFWAVYQLYFRAIQLNKRFR